MLEEEYINLWNTYFAGINGLNGQPIPMPPYDEYLEAENMLEDYLDIFRGVNTRNFRANGVNPWYYDHPFFDGDIPKLKEKPCIKYIMIGEARPKLDNDKPRTYFYNVNHLGNSSWLTAPYKAFNVVEWNRNLLRTNQDKINILLNLASKGYLLIDLFPFSIEYNTDIRPNINYLPFWNLLTARLCQLTNDPFTHINLLCNDNAQIGFSGPAATHHRIVLDLVGGVIALPNCHNFIVLTHLNEVYDINGLLIPPINIRNYIRTWDLLADNNYYLNDNLSPIIHNASNQFHPPNYKCECWDASYVNGPNSLFIRTAFNLLTMNHIIDIKGKYKIEVYNDDLDRVFSWTQAKCIAQDLGQGWRLPTANEIKELYINKEMLNFANYGFWAYWTSEEDGHDGYCYNGPNGKIYTTNKESEFYVRLVRDIE